MSLKEGYLMKKSPGMLKMWQRRWFVLDVGVLTYYKNHDEVGIRFQKQARVEYALRSHVFCVSSLSELFADTIR
jgi:hypothetical protein